MQINATYAYNYGKSTGLQKYLNFVTKHGIVAIVCDVTGILRQRVLHNNNCLKKLIISSYNCKENRSNL